MGRKSRNKGQRGELQAAKCFQRVFPDARRRHSSEESGGLNLGRDLTGIDGFCVQVQLRARPNIEKKLEEAVSAAHCDETPLAVTRRASQTDRGRPWMATMYLEDFLDLVELLKRIDCA